MQKSLGAQLVEHYRWLRQHGCNDSHSGNASVREGDRFWVTPTGACADLLDEGDLIACGLHGSCPAGASLDAPLHQAVYRTNSAAVAVLHSHGPYSVAMTLSGERFIPVDFEGAYYFSSVPIIDVSFERYVELAPRLVAAALSEHRIAVVRGHGVYAWGANINLAYKWTCSLELSAKTKAIATLAGTLT